jgi:hypothetical protein
VICVGTATTTAAATPTATSSACDRRAAHRQRFDSRRLEEEEHEGKALHFHQTEKRRVARDRAGSSMRAAHNCMKKEKHTATADRGLMRVAQNGNDK